MQPNKLLPQDHFSQLKQEEAYNSYDNYYQHKQLQSNQLNNQPINQFKDYTGGYSNQPKQNEYNNNMNNNMNNNINNNKYQQPNLYDNYKSNPIPSYGNNIPVQKLTSVNSNDRSLAYQNNQQNVFIDKFNF